MCFPAGKSDADTAQAAAVDSLSGLILRAGQDAFGSQGLGKSFCRQVVNSHGCLLPCARSFLPAPQRCSSSVKGPSPTCTPPPSEPATWDFPSRMRALCGDIHGEQVLGQRAAWKNPKSEFKTRGPSRDVLGLWGPLGYFHLPLLFKQTYLLVSESPPRTGPCQYNL